jgi:RNA polymerase sigma-70 factor, ECF subfamily
VTAPTVDSWAVVARAQSGDADAFAELYTEHAARIYRFINHRVPNRHVAEDLAQDVWVRALKSLAAVQYEGKDIGAWLMTVARNLVADHFKSSAVRRSSHRNIDDLIAERFEPIADDDPEREAARLVDCQRVRELILPLLPEMTDDQRRVLLLRFFEGMTLAEVADVMGKHIGAVKALQTRAVSRLARDRHVQALAVAP